jgi:hypothetical protein
VCRAADWNPAAWSVFITVAAESDTLSMMASLSKLDFGAFFQFVVPNPALTVYEID